MTTSPSTGERRTEMTMTQSDLTARIDEQLKATEGHTPDLAMHVEFDSTDGDDLGSGEYQFPYQIKLSTGVGLAVESGPFDALTDEDAALIASAPALRALLVEARAQLAAQAEALARVRGLADTWAREADATFGALPGDPRAGIRQAGRASELEMRAEALHVALGAQS